MPTKNIKLLLNHPHFAWEKFHYKTKLKKWNAQPKPQKTPETWTKVFFKEYLRLDKIILPSPETLGNVTLEEILMKRKSTRSFSQKPLSLEQISTLLYFSAGLRENRSPWVGNRTYPSGGARYPLEVYLLSQHSELPKGLYHYNLKAHSLEILLQAKEFDTLFFNQSWIKKSSLLIFVTAIFERNTIKYGDRGYRHILQESGHLSQNFYLVATALHMGISGIGGYLDDKINTLLDIDGVKESIIYALGTGNK